MDFHDIYDQFEYETGIHVLSNGNNMERFYTWLYYHPDYVDTVRDFFERNGANGFWKGYQDRTAYLDMLTGKTDPTMYAGLTADTGSAKAEKTTDNMISQANTEEARKWEEYMAQNSLLFNAQQLQSLGLSSNGVLSTGAASHSGVGAADNVKSNLTMQKYQEKMSMAKSILGMTSQMARAGIMGGALAASKNAAATLTSAASHSALGVLKNMDKRSGFGNWKTGETYKEGDFDNMLSNAASGYDLTQM